MSNIRKGLVTIVKADFVRELEALTRKYRVSIGSCGDCGYPSLHENVDITDERSGYSLFDDELRWVTPNDEYDWEYYSDSIIK